MATSLLLKTQGNDAMATGAFKEAEVLYTRAITKDPYNHFLFTNRALARIKLSSWDNCIDDCLKAIELKTDNMKAYHRMAQAQLGLRHPNEALSSALTAYDICLKSGDPSIGVISGLVLEAKKLKWEARERDRLRRRSPLMMELEDSLRQRGRAEVDEVRARVECGEVEEREGQEEIMEAEAETRKKVEELRSVFAVADPKNSRRREVPEYMIDNITFAFMHDPVITKMGHSYERSTIEQHLKQSPTDPLTREPLRINDLRPNYALKKACAEFLDENGWAVDW